MAAALVLDEVVVDDHELEPLKLESVLVLEEACDVVFVAAAVATEVEDSRLAGLAAATDLKKGAVRVKRVKMKGVEMNVLVCIVSKS